MENELIRALINRYNAGGATTSDLAEIEKLLEEGVIDLNDLHDVGNIDAKMQQLEHPSPGANLDDRFYQMLALEKSAHKPSRKWSFNWLSFSWPRIAIASLLVLTGVAIGFFIGGRSTSSSNSEIALLSNEVKEMREMMMLSLLEKESATERLRAVSLSQQMDEASTKVTDALLQTLNKDDNVNVRLAALDALKPYASNNDVRVALVQSIANQTSPLVQVALAECMASLQLKSSVKELQKLIESDRTPDEVKTRIKKTIDVLI